MKRNAKRKGFTLIELVVVIAVLGILAVIAIPKFSGIREKANESAVIANLRNLQTAAETVAISQNIEITVVTTEQATVELGVEPKGPGTTSYTMEAGVATADVDTSIPYPDDGVLDFTGIK